MDTLPLFPLGTVLFPGVVLPLHVFEPRYRELIRRLMLAPAGLGREFGVIGIRQGQEVGEGQILALHEVGCTAELRQVTSLADGAFDIVTVGRRRFRLDTVESSPSPYLCARVTWLPEESSDPDEAALLATGVSEVFDRYMRLLRTRGEAALPQQPEPDAGTAGPTGPVRPSGRAGISLSSVPPDPLMLSHLVAANAPLTYEDRQALLGETSTVRRLRRELQLLKREAAMLHRLRAVPVPLAELRVPLSLN